MSLLKFGPRQFQAIGSYVPALAMYGTAGFIAMCHFTEWRVVMEYVPFYGSKYPPREEENN